MPEAHGELTALAFAALSEITDPAEVGDPLGIHDAEPGVVEVRFACALPAYAGWYWSVSTADLPDQEPTVLEVQLLPGDGALLAPPWVPWAERLAEWRRQHPDERLPGAPDPDGIDDAEHDEDEGGDLDEDDLAVDDGLDELDDVDLEGDESPDDGGSESDDVPERTAPHQGR